MLRKKTTRPELILITRNTPFMTSNKKQLTFVLILKVMRNTQKDHAKKRVYFLDSFKNIITIKF